MTIEHDKNGRIISRIYSDGEKVTYEYDERGNRISMTYPNGKKIFINPWKVNLTPDEA